MVLFYIFFDLKCRRASTYIFFHLFGPKLSITSKDFWNCLQVCLGSETVCPEKDRQAAFYSPLGARMEYNEIYHNLKVCSSEKYRNIHHHLAMSPVWPVWIFGSLFSVFWLNSCKECQFSMHTYSLFLTIDQSVLIKFVHYYCKYWFCVTPLENLN